MRSWPKLKTHGCPDSDDPPGLDDAADSPADDAGDATWAMSGGTADVLEHVLARMADSSSYRDAT